MMNLVTRRGRAVVAVAALMSLAMAGVAEARAGRSGSFGSRGSRTYSPPAQTQTAPNQARPFDRTVTQPGPQTGQPGLRQPGAPGQLGAPARPASRFGGGFLGGLLGAGLLGALLGAGFFGGLGSLAGILGFLLQLALVAGVVMLALRFFRGRGAASRPAYQGSGINRGLPGQHRSALGAGLPGTGGPVGLGGGPAMGAAAGLGAAAHAPLQVQAADFDAFERLLYDVQAAYHQSSEGRLRELATPEMAAYFGEELAQDEARGVKAVVTNVKLLQGDLSESWREGTIDYATVAMRFSLNEGMVDRATGRVVEGDPSRPTEATEIWTFRREPGEAWKLAAIQQTT